MEPVIRVAIADDHAFTRVTLRQVLECEDDFVVLAEAEDGAEAVDVVGRTHPDLVVLDHRMPGLSGVEAARSISERHPDVAIAMLTSEEDPQVRRAAEDAGVDVFLLKGGRADSLLEELRAAAGRPHGSAGPA